MRTIKAVKSLYRFCFSNDSIAADRASYEEGIVSEKEVLPKVTCSEASNLRGSSRIVNRFQ